MARRARASAKPFRPNWDLEEIFEEQDPVYQEIDFSEFGVDPRQPTQAKPGSPEKVLMLAARYAAGLPLWHEEDCYDHGPVHSEEQKQEEEEYVED